MQVPMQFRVWFEGKISIRTLVDIPHGANQEQQDNATYDAMQRCQDETALQIQTLLNNNGFTTLIESDYCVNITRGEDAFS